MFFKKNIFKLNSVSLHSASVITLFTTVTEHESGCNKGDPDEVVRTDEEVNK